jgi:uncharacterized membrane protein YkvA (DUF1232 family)
MRAVITTLSPEDYSEQYSERSFWEKLARFASFAGYEVVEKALCLYYAAARPETPNWAKVTVYGALAYFVMPADVVADILPIAGYTDDLAVLVFALTTIGSYVDDGVRNQAARVLARWFPLVPDADTVN